MEKLFLLGIKHSGKTTLMERLSELTGLPGCDSDALLKERFNPLPVREWYRAHGKECFMREELSAVRAFLDGNRGKSLILSLGGGASDNAPLMELLREEGLTVYIRRDEDSMLPVIMKDGIPPFLDEDDPEGSFHELYARRDAIYRKEARITLDLGGYGSVDEDAGRLLRAIREER